MTLVDPSSRSIIPENEAARMVAVRRYDILDTPPDGAFDRLTAAIASRLFNVPIAIISVVDHDRIWFKSHHGLEVHQIDREPGLCASAILQAEPLILANAKTKLHGRSLADESASAELALAANRVAAVARVHQHIYMSDTVETTECGSYLRRLCEDLSDMLPEGRGPIVVQSITVELPTEQIAPLGLILNELVTNAAKHGQGVITVAFEQGETGYAMHVSDEGEALPEGFDPFARSGLGMKVVASLTNQLGRKFVMRPSENGARLIFAIKFPRGSHD